MPLPMLDILTFIDEVAHLDPDPKFVYQTYSYVYIGYGWRAALEICEGEYTLWVFECDGVILYASQWHNDPIEFTFYPPDHEDPKEQLPYG